LLPALAFTLVAVFGSVGFTLGQNGFLMPTTAEAAFHDHSSLDHDDGPSGHEASEGLTLSGDDGESVYTAAACGPDAPVRSYSVVAINVEITLNRFLDYEPQGRMYVLEEDLARVRAEEAQNREARAGRGDPAVSVGLQGDAIQPLTLRVNPGECLRVSLRNELRGEAASLHLHGSGLQLAASGAPALATNPDTYAATGETVVYEWAVADDEPEATHYFHSHGDARNQTNHGLFGAVVVEPKGSTYLDPIGGGELRSGWSAIIRDPNGSHFREFAIYYHEIGNERYRHLDRNGRLVIQVDPYTSSYRPGDRGINYRSEPFMNRLALQQQQTGRFDKSMAYSSYAFGDPATPIARSYLGDPVKQRIIHGGSEVFHVHHVHGGATRWRRQPGVEPSAFDTGLVKHPPLLPQASERTDSQSIGPSETFDVADECGSGGCQAGAGDYLIHCHVAHHYLSGMWMIWRVYNTQQNGPASTDLLPPLLELPDRAGRVSPAVTSNDLVGRTVDWKGQTFQITSDSLAAWVERQLPPRGMPKGYDASVFDWDRDSTLYLGEPETDQEWPGYRSPAPGTRPPLRFDPLTGKLAYPFMSPHLGKRPPFAPNHGPAPFLEPIHQGTDPARPGENGPWSLCPTGTRPKSFTIHAIGLSLTLNERVGIVDPVAQLYVLKEDEDAVRANNGLKTPLAIRANAGEDCIDVVFKSELEDNRDNAFMSKANVHIHFVQFDVQASDGVNTGFNYESSVRPFTVEGETLAEDAAAGASSARVRSVERFQPGVLVGVGMEQTATFEVRRIREINGDALLFDEPMRNAHGRGEIVSTEFVRYRWYPDVQFGTAYFHDHVDALHSWRHGLFGALIAEPPGSSYHDPRSGAEVRSGPLADVHTDAVVSADVTGSFREMVMFVQDDNQRTRIGDSTGSSFNLRVEPLASRAGDPAQRFSSTVHGDPATPLLEAFVGDPVVVRTLVAGTNDVHTWHVDGHWFRIEPFSLTSPPVNTVHLGISERFDLFMPRAGGPQALPGDYLYYSGRASKLREGSWGILRVLEDAASGLRRLPGHEASVPPPPAVCPGDAPQKAFSVAAVEASLPMLGRSQGSVYVLDADREALAAGTKAPEPLVLHVNVGDCVQVQLSNETPGPVSFHADMLATDPRASLGVEAGFDPPQSVAPGEARLYTYYAHPEVGETVALVRDWGNVVDNPRLGLYGAIVVGPRGARYTDPVSGEDMGLSAGWRTDVHPTDGPAYRDFALFLQDEDPIIGTAVMPYVEQVQGVVGLNYRTEPLQARLNTDRDPAHAFSSTVHGDPATPMLEAYAGDAVKIRVLAPFSEQAHVFSLEAHEWPQEPGRRGTTMMSSVQVGGLEAVTLALVGGAGGRLGLPGDYLYGDHREPYRDAGLWGLLRVYGPGADGAALRALAP
jgi:hypothetical protein